MQLIIQGLHMDEVEDNKSGLKFFMLMVKIGVH